VNRSRFIVGWSLGMCKMSVPTYDQYPSFGVRAMRTSGSVLAWTNLTLANFDHAFMWARMCFFSAASLVSRKPTDNRTPFAAQRFATITARAIGDGRKSGITRASRSTRTRLVGLIAMAVAAAASHLSFGNDTGRQIRSLAISQTSLPLRDTPWDHRDEPSSFDTEQLSPSSDT
jgi:hypothetical protein